MDSDRAQRLLSHPRMPKAGEAIAGRYEVHHAIGTGAFGAVYLATDREAGGRLAIKVLQPEKSDQQGFVDRFWQEVKVIRTLTHHNTIKVWDAGKTERGCLFMLMEYVDGVDLQTLIEKEGPLGPERVVRIAKQVLLSLAEAHGIGVVHRDLKPLNIMVRQLPAEPDYVKVLDFGIAKALGSELSIAQTKAGEFLGTAAYASPELLRNESIGPVADIYSLGLILLEMLTGKRAFTADSVPAIIAQQLSPEPAPIPAHLAATPLGRVIARALMKDPRGRFATCEEMLEALVSTAKTAAIGAATPAAHRPGRLPEAGEVINDRYHLLRLLGTGGFGSVYLAEDRLAGGKLAIKVINAGALTEVNAADRFRQEATVVRHLHHHNTIKIWDVGTTESGCPFMAMEYVDGLPLDALLEQQGRLPVARTLRIAVQILRSLAEAHAQGIVHRDLKPGNILVSQPRGESDYVKVLDFGIAKALSPELSLVETQAGQILCTPAYAAPELLKGQGIAPATDVYAVGLLIVELLTGVRAIPGSSPMEWMVHQIAPEPIEIPPEIEMRPLGRVLRKAVEKDVTKRYKDADEMLDALMEAEQIESQPSGAALVDLQHRAAPAPGGQGADTLASPTLAASPRAEAARAETLHAAGYSDPPTQRKATPRAPMLLILVVLAAGGTAVAVVMFSSDGEGESTSGSTASRPALAGVATEVDSRATTAGEAESPTPSPEPNDGEARAATDGSGAGATHEPGADAASSEGTGVGLAPTDVASAQSPTANSDGAASETDGTSTDGASTDTGSATRDAERARRERQERREREAAAQAERVRAEAETAAQTEREREAAALVERDRAAAEAAAQAEREREAEAAARAERERLAALDLPEQLEFQQLDTVLRTSLSQAARCRGDAPEGETVEIEVQITVANDGHVTGADAGEHPGADCLERVVRTLEFPPFRRSSMRFRYTYRLR